MEIKGTVTTLTEETQQVIIIPKWYVNQQRVKILSNKSLGYTNLYL